MNKLQDYGTSFDAWEKWRDIWVISPQSQKKLLLTFLFLFIRPIGGKEKENFCNLLLPSRLFFSSLSPSSPSFPLAGISTAPSFFLLSRFVSWVFTLVLHVLWDDCWWNLFKSWEMFYGHGFMVVWCGISRVWSCLLVYMKELGSAENKTHRVCMSFEFSGFNTDVFAFLWYFS